MSILPQGLFDGVAPHGDPKRDAEDEIERRHLAKRRCIHRGESTGLVSCRTCGGKANLPSYACEIHGTCTEARRAVDPEVVWCLKCPDSENLRNG